MGVPDGFEGLFQLRLRLLVCLGSYELKKICKYASNKKFTHLFVVSEKKKTVNGYVHAARS